MLKTGEGNLSPTLLSDACSSHEGRKLHVVRWIERKGGNLTEPDDPGADPNWYVHLAR